MGILQITTDTTGQIGVNPRRVKIITTSDLTAVTTAGYLNPATLEGYTIYNTDIIDMWYGATGSVGGAITTPGTYAQFTTSISNGVITLQADPGNVVPGATEGNFAIFNNSSGQLIDKGYAPTDPTKGFVIMANGANIVSHIATYADTEGTIGIDAATAINGGNIQAGLSGTAGTVASFPATSSKGSLVLAAVANTGNTITTISNAAMGQASVVSIPDPGASTANFLISASSANTQSMSGNLLVNGNPAVVSKVVTATFSQLATAGKVNIFVAPTVTAQIAILDIKVFKSTGLSGGGGDRLLSLADGTLVFNNAGITAALLGTPIFTLWGGTGNPIASSSQATVSTAGANVYLQYVGGTTDFTAGSVIVAVTYAQVTA